MSTLPDDWYQRDELFDPDLLGDDSSNFVIKNISEYADNMGFDLSGKTRHEKFVSLKETLAAAWESSQGSGSSKRSAPSNVPATGTKRSKRKSFIELMQQRSSVSSLGDRIEATVDRLLLTAASPMGQSFLEDVKPTQIGEANVGNLLFAVTKLPTENYSADILDTEEFMIYKLTALADRDGFVTIEFVDAVNCEHENSFTSNRVSIRRFACLKGQLAQMYSQLEPIGTKEATREANSKQYFDEFDGKNLNYLDKAKLEDRVYKSRIARRMVAESILKSFGPSTIDFDGATAWGHLVAKGRTWASRDSEEIKRHLDLDKDDTSHYFKLLDPKLPCMSNGRIFELIFETGVTLSSLDNTRFPVSLQDFSTQALGDPHDFTAKQLMLQACVNLEYWLLFTTGPGMKDITLVVRERLGSGDLSAMEWDGDYVKYLIEKALHDVLFDVHDKRHDKYLLLHPTGTTSSSAGTTGVADITTHMGVASILRQAFHDITANQQKQYTFLRLRTKFAAMVTPPAAAAPKHVTFNSFIGKYGSTPAPAPATVAAPTVTPIPPTLKNSGSFAKAPPLTSPPATQGVHVKEEPNLEKVCKGHLLHKLKVLAPENKQPWQPCTRTGCRYPHHDIFKLTKAQVHPLVDLLPAATLSDELKAEAHKAITARNPWKE